MEEKLRKMYEQFMFEYCVGCDINRGRCGYNMIGDCAVEKAVEAVKEKKAQTGYHAK